MKMRATDRVTVCGLPGTGKTTLTKYLCSLYEPDLLIYDPLAQYVNFPSECRYIPKSDSLTEFDSVCRQLCARSNVVFVIEEAERYLGQGKALGPYAFDLINRGRNWGVGVVAVTRRIQRLSKDFFDLCQHVFFFKCGLKSRDYIKDMIGQGECQIITGLERFHFLYYDLEAEETEVATLELEGRQHIAAEKVVVQKEEEHLPLETKKLAPLKPGMETYRKPGVRETTK